MKSILHRLVIEAPVAKVYEALATQEGLSGWWTPDVTATPETGSMARFAFDKYVKEMVVEELKPMQKVQWRWWYPFVTRDGKSIRPVMRPAVTTGRSFFAV